MAILSPVTRALPKAMQRKIADAIQEGVVYAMLESLKRPVAPKVMGMRIVERSILWALAQSSAEAEVVSIRDPRFALALEAGRQARDEYVARHPRAGVWTIGKVQHEAAIAWALEQSID